MLDQLYNLITYCRGLKGANVSYNVDLESWENTNLFYDGTILTAHIQVCQQLVIIWSSNSFILIMTAYWIIYHMPILIFNLLI